MIAPQPFPDVPVYRHPRVRLREWRRDHPALLAELRQWLRRVATEVLGLAEGVPEAWVWLWQLSIAQTWTGAEVVAAAVVEWASAVGERIADTMRAYTHVGAHRAPHMDDGQSAIDWLKTLKTDTEPDPDPVLAPRIEPVESDASRYTVRRYEDGLFRFDSPTIDFKPVAWIPDALDVPMWRQARRLEMAA